VNVRTFQILILAFIYIFTLINVSVADHFTAKLSVRMTSGPDFVTTNFTFFDCNTYSSCTQCVSSSFPCDWCVDGHRCTHDTAENCRNDILVTGVSVSNHHSYLGETRWYKLVFCALEYWKCLCFLLWAEQFLKRRQHVIEKTVIEIDIDLFASGNPAARKDI
jgi:hypothetical protein